MLPPTMRVLARGTAAVLGAVALVWGAVGAAVRSPLVALNAIGFVGSCSLSITVLVYSVVLERVGLDAARKAATVLVAVLGGSALLCSVALVALLHRADVTLESTRFGLHSVAGMVVLAILAVVLAVLWRDRQPPT